jgi:putative nucleotidyltransferase with HDIG domain
MAMAEGPDIHEIPPILVQFLERGLRIPPCPAVLSQLAEAVQNPDRKSGELARLIRLDPALTTALLKVANSALYGASRQISTIENAVLRLGFMEVMKIAIALKSKEFLSAPKLSVFSGWLYEHSLRTGFLLRRLWREINPRYEEVYFTAGILHDIGRMVLAQVDPDYAKFCLNLPMLLREDQAVVLMDEKNRWGNDHAEIGSALCEFWNLPKILQTMIQEHHTGSFSDRSSIVVHVADLWSVILTMPTRVPPRIYAALLETRICPRSEMTPEQATALGKQVDQEVEALMSV